MPSSGRDATCRSAGTLGGRVMGAVAVPLNYRQRVPEYRFQIEDSGARLLLANSRYTAEAEELERVIAATGPDGTRVATDDAERMTIWKGRRPCQMLK